MVSKMIEELQRRVSLVVFNNIQVRDVLQGFQDENNE